MQQQETKLSAGPQPSPQPPTKHSQGIHMLSIPTIVNFLQFVC
jgi:hypothetical protein